MLLALLMMGCDRCDEDALSAALSASPGMAVGESPATAATLLAESCTVPEALAAWLRAPESAPPAEAAPLWAAACPGGPELATVAAKPRRDRVQLAIDACALDAEAIWLDGFPLLALTTAAWMQSEAVDAALIDPTRAALRGQPILTFPSAAPPTLPALTGDAAPLTAAPDAAALVTVTGGQVFVGGSAVATLDAAGLLPPSAPFMTGPLPDHRHPLLTPHQRDGAWVFAVDAALPAETLTRLAVSLSAPGATVSLLGTTGEGLALRSLTVPAADAGPGTPVATAAEVSGTLALGEAPCGPAPAGMQCVPGGKHGDVVLSTFYVDTQPVTAEAYAACAAKGSCARRSVERLQWQDAARYCTWAGKRLPTPWELQAAGGATAAAWTDAWGPLDAVAPDSRDPLGPCDGAPTCAKHTKRTAVGAGVEALATSAGATARCVADQPYLTRFPAAIIAEAPPTPVPLTEAQRAIFRDIKEDPIWEKPVCQGDWGTVTLNCRDPLSYVKSNERRAFVWADTIHNRGGAYVGVGSDQNYSYAALSKAELVWLIDYDPDVVSLHRINRAFTIKGETPQDFIAHYNPRNVKASTELLRTEYAGNPDLEHILYVFGHYRPRLYDYYYSRSLPSGRKVETEWLRNPELYAHIRLLWQQDRIWPVKGDLTKFALASIGDAARKLGVPVRILYTSNAPDVWSGRLIENYKNGVLALPMDRQSIVLQTFLYPTGFGGPTHHHWHYNVQAGLEQQDLMQRPGFTNVRELIYRRIATDDLDFTVSGLRSE